MKGTGVDEDVLGRYGVKEKCAKGLMVLNFVKRMEMAIVNNHFKKRGRMDGVEGGRHRKTASY